MLIAALLSVTIADTSIHQFTMTDIEGHDVALSNYKGKVMLVVNVASECSFTPQYAELQQLYERYADQGLVVLGFPANDFLKQEPGTDDEIDAFCMENYDVTFPMFSKISVRGKDKHPLYAFLTDEEQNGKSNSRVRWNFQKYLLDQNGELVTYFAPRTTPLSEEVTQEIEVLLASAG